MRRYWNDEIASKIVQLKHIRFDNPMFSLTTTFNREDFTRLLTSRFEVPPENVQRFFDTARGMNFYDDQSLTTGQLFEKFFPGREDVVRLLMEPITYANGSTLEDPAITYGIVFSNFMAKGVYIYEGGTDDLICKMSAELRRNGVDWRINCDVSQIEVDRRGVQAVVVNGRRIGCGAVISNSNLKSTIFDLVGAEKFDRGFIDQARDVRLNNSSTQVYMALSPAVPSTNRPATCCFSSTAPLFRTAALLSRDITSRTFSFYYPRTRPRASSSLPWSVAPTPISATGPNWSRSSMRPASGT